MISNTDEYNVGSMDANEWGMDCLGPLDEDVLKEDLLMLDCLNPSEFDGWFGDAMEEGDGMDDTKITSPKNKAAVPNIEKKAVCRMPTRSKSPPAKRLHRMETHEQEVRPASPVMMEMAVSSPAFSSEPAHNTWQSPQAPISSGIDDQYNQMIEKLALSMQRSEESRARLVQQCRDANVTPPFGSRTPAQTRQIPPTTSQPVTGLAGFLSGRTTSLTSGLEQSRKQMQAYMNQMNSHTL